MRDYFGPAVVPLYALNVLLLPPCTMTALRNDHSLVKWSFFNVALVC